MTRLFLLTAALLIGIAACVGTLAAADLDLRNAALTFLAVAGIAAAWASRRPRPVLIFLWVVALTYGKAFFVYPGEEVNDFHGIYWILADVFFVCLLALWARGRGEEATPSRALWPWLLPFVMASALSSVLAARSDWALFDLLRIFKFGLVLWYMRWNAGPAEWWAAMAGLGFATFAQACLSVLQVALRNTSAGILGALGMGGGEQVQAQAEAMEGAMGGFFRAYGTIGHPANLATYFLITVPPLLALAFAVSGRFWKTVVWAAALFGLAGLACTQSRGPWVFAAVQVAILLIGILWFRMASNREVLLVVGIGTLAGLSVIMGFQDFIVERFRRDYSDSVALRDRDVQTAFRVFADSPWTGVGPNNYSTKILEYDPFWAELYAEAPAFQRQFRSRTMVAPHNLYMFLLAETGLLGFLGFVVFLAGVVGMGIRTTIAATGLEKAVRLGLLVGIGGVLAQSAINFSLWVDPILYTFALVAAMLAKLPFKCETR